MSDGFYPGIIGTNKIFSGVFLVPVENAANERRDEFNTAFCAGDRLSERKQEREVAVDALFLELFGGFDAFPGGSDFDQDPFAANACLFIKVDDVFRLCDGCFAIKREACVDL